MRLPPSVRGIYGCPLSVEIVKRVMWAKCDEHMYVSSTGPVPVYFLAEVSFDYLRILSHEFLASLQPSQTWLDLVAACACVALFRFKLA